MDRTVRIQLHPTPEQAQALHETSQQFTQAFNAVCRYGWQHREKNGVKLHHATYYATKASCPGLVSDYLIQARVKATEALKSAFTWKAKHEANYQKKVTRAKKRGQPVPKFKPMKCPQSVLCPVRYNVKTFSLNWQNQGYNIREKYLASLAQDGTPVLSGSPVKRPIVSTLRSQGQASCL